jgi:hypothetical protein
MTSWADGSGDAFKNLDAAQGGTGAKLPGQHDITPEERRGYRADYDHYAWQTGEEYIKARRKEGDTETNKVTDGMASAKKIGQASDDSLWGGKQEYLKAAQQQPLGDLSDPSARLRAMSFITQDKPLGPIGKETDATDDRSNCSGASIVGAAFLAEGPEGLKKVMKALEAQDPTGGSTNRSAEYKALKAKLAKDPNSLSVADIQSLQQSTTEILKKNQLSDKELQSEIGPDATGVHGKTMDKFMNNKHSADLVKMFEKNGMEIQGVDIDGALDDKAHTGMDHWVVKLKGKDGKEAIYDPLARRGGQIIDFDEGVKHYDNAWQDTVGKPGK